MCDTDSVVSDCPLPDDAMVSPTALGLFKLEQTTPGADNPVLRPEALLYGRQVGAKGGA